MDTINAANAWVGEFIMKTRRKGRQQTEKSVLDSWKVSLDEYRARTLQSRLPTPPALVDDRDCIWRSPRCHHWCSPHHRVSEILWHPETTQPKRSRARSQIPVCSKFLSDHFQLYAGRHQTWRPHNDNNVRTAPSCTVAGEATVVAAHVFCLSHQVCNGSWQTCFPGRSRSGRPAWINVCAPVSLQLPSSRRGNGRTPVPLPVHLCQTVLHSTFDEFVFTLSFFLLSSFFSLQPHVAYILILLLPVH
jgi:hypothetical protein